MAFFAKVGYRVLLGDNRVVHEQWYETGDLESAKAYCIGYNTATIVVEAFVAIGRTDVPLNVPIKSLSNRHGTRYYTHRRDHSTDDPAYTEMSVE